MNRETISKALGGISDEFKSEALELTLPVSSAASGTEETIMPWV